jgi:hypothetical protein
LSIKLFQHHSDRRPQILLEVECCNPSYYVYIHRQLLLCRTCSRRFFPTEFKHASLHPQLKKQPPPPENLSSYRPMSNLNFISKIVSRINQHFALPPNQSAYRKFKSTKTALLRITNLLPYCLLLPS